MEERKPKKAIKKKGVVKQLSGCVMLFLGGLNLMLSFKSGMKPDPFNYILLFSGALVLGLGVYQSKTA